MRKSATPPTTYQDGNLQNKFIAFPNGMKAVIASFDRDILSERVESVSVEIEAEEYEPVIYPFPSTYPGQWLITDRNLNGITVKHLASTLMVICSVCRERDGKLWLHVSFSHPDHLPSYKEQCQVKRVFVGAEKFAYSVFVPESQHVNDHPYCLHLWSCLDSETGGVTPDFRKGGAV